MSCVSTLESYERVAPIDIPLDTSAKSLKGKEKELREKEAELQRREEELRRRKHLPNVCFSSRVEIEEKIWPPFFPIIHHNISKEIPIHLQHMQYVAFTTLLGLLLCLTWNVIAVTTAWIEGQGPIIWLLSIIYLINAVPGAYFLWYQLLYRAMRTDSSFNFGWFFLFYPFHIAFCVFATVTPPFLFDWNSLTGIMPAISLFRYSASTGVSLMRLRCRSLCSGSRFYDVSMCRIIPEYLFVAPPSSVICNPLSFITFSFEIARLRLLSRSSLFIPQQVLVYLRRSGKAAEIKREAAKKAVAAAL
ncbi:Secretory carrier-associated membrane protein 1 [Hibiscus syriacus]|uniref:Secretory carrier-associated membrane protein n=1 Tax=Hibiscus syriacus TaxID=106335 RepID=A0A6A2XWI9_HIBSY|nr:Secretory carrier-associated membrane protein 1 [Hibiscus syriacus]